MIKKLNNINNIGSFLRFNWNLVNPETVPTKQGGTKQNDTDFRKFNILYGENGTGKSTIVKIFKSLDSDDSSLINKNWDREDQDREINLLINTSTASFTETTGWKNNSLKGKVIFFDKKFINDYILSFPSGRDVHHDKNTGNLILYLGDFGYYRSQLDNLENLRQTLDRTNQDLKITNDHEINTSISSYSYEEIKQLCNRLKSDSLPKIDDLKLKIKTIEEEIQKIGKTINKSTEISSLNLLQIVDKIPLIPPQNINNAFNFSVSRGTTEILKRIKNKEDFILRGLHIIQENNLNKCPFCEQNIKKGKDLIHLLEEYRTVFDDEFTKIQTNTQSILEGYKEQLLNLLSFQQPVFNQQYLSNINKLIGYEAKLITLSLSKEEKDLIELEIKFVDNKLKNILRKLDKNNLSAISKIITRINSDIEKYNAEVKKINGVLNKTKNDLKTGQLFGQKNKLEINLKTNNQLLFVVENWQKTIRAIELENLYTQNEKQIQNIEQLLRLFIDKVKTLFKQFSDTYFSEIESYSSLFCPSLELKICSSRSTYDLRAGEVLCGFEVMYKDKNRLTELSEGERQAIALAFFLAYLKKNPDKEDKIIVFDDPITSFDAGKRKMCAEYIFKETLSFEQCFIFTCDPLFKSYCYKTISRKYGNELSFYYVLKSASSSIHHRDKSQVTIYSVFKSEFRNIGTVLGTDENIIVFGQKLRYCIEEIKDKYLGYGQEAFDNVLDQVKSSNFEKLHNSIDELQGIYCYCNTGGLAHYPRDGSTSWEELRSYINRYLNLKL